MRVLLYCWGVFSLLVWNVARGDEGLWWIEQDFVKLGKKDVYEMAKKGMLSDLKWKGIYAFEEVDGAQYVFLTQLKGYSDFGSFMRLKAATPSLQEEKGVVLPYLTSIHFTIATLHQYLENCSFVPKGRASLLSYPALYFYLLSIAPEDVRGFEVRLQEIALTEQKKEGGTCFRTWKMLCGVDLPRYVVAIFAASEKEVVNKATSLGITKEIAEHVIRQQKEGVLLVRPDLSYR